MMKLRQAACPTLTQGASPMWRNAPQPCGRHKKSGPARLARNRL
ncbi:hypothetical protein DWUX_417 [Desulfovibrio diazotrophicus]|nr:hypothetical protein DWUX_417 [Desulfovibrio diazotrophicus]